MQPYSHAAMELLLAMAAMEAIDHGFAAAIVVVEVDKSTNTL